MNDAWSHFARANDGEHLVPPGILGQSLWTSIADQTTRQLYAALLQRLRNGTGPVRFRFRCDGPTQRRLLEMRLAATVAGEVEFHTRLVASQAREDVSLLDAEAPRSDALLTICGWCMRIPIPADQWLEVESAIPELGLFEEWPLPMLSHGMCPRCYDTMLASLDDPDRARSGEITLGALPPV